MRIPFTKMHGLGNAFVILDCVSNDIELSTEQIRHLCDHHRGVGCDQILLVSPAADAGVDFDYRIFNTDGREVEHCGNGARCFALFVTEKGLCDKNTITVRTVNRTLCLTIKEDGDVTVDMERPEFAPARIPFRADMGADQYTRRLDLEEGQLDVTFCALSMGNPHAVIIVEDLVNTAVKDIGEALGNHPDFPEGVNVGFMQVVAEDEIRLRVYERGAGETQACGTGACAAVVAGCLLGLLSDTVTVILTGGRLSIQWQQADSPVLMTGPATTVFEGTIEL